MIYNKNNDIFLGLSYTANDTSAALLVNNNLVACCEEERYNLKKHTREFPINAINDCLKIANISLDNVDRIGVGFDPDIYHNYDLKKSMNRRVMPSREKLKKEISEKLNYKNDILFFEHHLCHVACAYFTSGFDESIIYSNDGIGEINSSMIAIAKNNEINVIHRHNNFPNSIGIAYAAITRYLGWGSGDEGIVMGLAPFGDHNKLIPNTSLSYKDVFEDAIKVDKYNYYVNEKWFAFPKVRDKWVTEEFENLFGPRRVYDEEITDHHKNIANAIQKRLEAICLLQLKEIKRNYPIENLCISGGVGLNCSLNGKIEESNLFKKLYIPAPSGDNGISIGACFLMRNMFYKTFPKKIISFSLGSRFNDNEILNEIKKKNLFYEKPSNFSEFVANLINEKNIVGWFQGGAEFGPRALGNRSILSAPYPESMRDHINNRVKFREEFRPFAPVIIADEVSDYFHIKQESPFMLMATKVKKDKKNRIPAVIHVDDSARVQTVTKENNNEFYSLLKAYKKLTGVPVLLNTSFNVKGQPIVNNPVNAIDTFLNTNIDVLVIGSFIIKK